ncbi:heterokaryon incompatibility protein-domain-containing protein [Microdochium trichocladiopsis]|uniref:Heterokaryon incompatibility protein-domain-containing protein n=1 Tax=Microdochium trichocladiopsis TaxID=1682393 RepID=A0A9P9BSJ4_9PEZI|nr:heterokaryon incompatibility protein-domain-containing protein [Microdochium trichocladiopsis]KAH7034649.1 heterokaryon incompatibility protein-domain-containing protein [Microdochium trichocladiopsis]
MAPTYEYTSLEGPGSIRIIHLEPGRGDDTLSCTLETAALGDGVKYEALSYAWGDPSDRRTIKCHGRDLDITTSLFKALQQLRRASETRLLWADAVCINQQDMEEKSEQVGLMSQIYSQPQRVLIWLGDDMVGLEGVQESLEAVLRMIPPVHYDAESIRECSLRFCRETARLTREGRSSETLSHHDWRPINALLDRTWFSRKWIVQEVSMASGHVPRIVMCGSIEIAWETLSTIAYAMFTYGFFSQATSESLLYAPGPSPSHHFSCTAIQPTIAVVNAYVVQMIQHFTTGNLLDCAMATYAFKCTDSRDHIYSLLGLARRGPYPVTIEPDYSKSAEQVLFDFARSVLIQDQNPNLLGLAPNNESEITGKDTERGKLPSWVPDLVCGAPATSLVGFSIREAVFQAGLQVPSGTKTEMQAIYEDESKRHLHVQGRIVDVVQEVALCPFLINVPEDKDVDEDTLRRKRAKIWFDDCLRVAFSYDGDEYRQQGGTNNEDDCNGGENATETTVGLDTGDGSTGTLRLWNRQTPDVKERFARTMMMDHCGLRDPLHPDTVEAMVDYVGHVCGYFDKDYVVSDEALERMIASGGMIEFAIFGTSVTRRFCISRSGRFGQVRTNTQKGDLVCVVVGAQVPLVIRPTGGGEETYELIGDCYLDGVMHGEAMEDRRYKTVEIVFV